MVLPSEMVAHAKTVIVEITPEEVAVQLSGQLVVIDVREPDEYANGALPGAVNIPRGVLEFELDRHPTLRCEGHPVTGKHDTTIILYCRSGGRSALAAASLQGMGFTDVRSMAEGFNGWCQRGLPSD